ncbi:RNA ligase/cyclic nucleotide phosphodiesterase [Podospora didyma]|uniref:RNA ligase/cyclic nucleotide phosphodiesterase n=1 Tax=Podospora didyma TaxID=330526 RepID=A0AAE0P533_9PEZI|nr:RNA ligase/cyclic nucleotide phosphodiesterase [Podospora didyma]
MGCILSLLPGSASTVTQVNNSKPTLAVSPDSMSESSKQQWRAARPDYPIGVPSKFDPEGNVQPFPGNTIVAHLAPASPLYASMLDLYNKLASHPLSSLYALLPPPSWHMTVFEGVCDQVRGPGYWPRDLPPSDSPSSTTTLEACTALFAQKLADFDLQCDPPFRLTVTGFTSLAVGIGVRLQLRTPKEEARFRGLRDRLAEVLQIRHPHHDNYLLHLSMTYFVRYPTPEQAAELTALLAEHFEGMPKEFELGAPEFCTFENMFKFDRSFYLKNRE